MQQHAPFLPHAAFGAAAAPSSPSHGDVAASGGGSGSGWKSQILSQVSARATTQQLPFLELFAAYATLLAQARQLKTRVFQLEQEVMTTRQLASLSATPAMIGGNGGMAGRGSMDLSHSMTFSGGGGGGGMSSTTQKLLEEKILKLQEDLTAAYRLQSENSHTSLRLKEQAEADEKALLKKEEELAQRTRQVVTLQQTLAAEREATKQRQKSLEQTVEMLRSEGQASRALAKAHEAKLEQLLLENEQLEAQLIRISEEQANGATEMSRVKQELARATHVANALAEAKAKEAAEGPRAIAPVEMDLSDMNALVDHVAWSSSCQVEIPQDRKRTIRGHRGPSTCIRYNTAGTLMASAGVDGVVKIYDARAGTNRASLRGSKEAIMNVQFSADDAHLLASGNDNIARVWSLRSSRIEHTFVGHSAKIWAATFTLDGDMAITGSHDRTIRLWDIKEANGACKRTILCGSACNFLSLNRNDQMLASAHLDTHVRFWRAHTGELVHDLGDAHDGQVTSVEFSKDGTRVATASRDNTVRIIDLRTYKVMLEMTQSIKTPFRNLINWNRAVWSPDDKHLLAGGHAGDLFFWATDTGKLEAILPGVSLNDGSFGAPEARSASASVSGMGGMSGISPSSSAAALAAANTVSEQAIACVDWNRNGRQVSSCDHGGNIHVWEGQLE